MSRRWALVGLWLAGVLTIIGALAGSLLCAIGALAVLMGVLVMTDAAWSAAERLDQEARTSTVYLGGYEGPQRIVMPKGWPRRVLPPPHSGYRGVPGAGRPRSTPPGPPPTGPGGGARGGR